MKTIKVVSLAVVAFGMSFLCSAQTKQDNKETIVSNTDKVEMYYFHYTRRCATCNSVQSVSKEAVAEFYGNKVAFTDFNLDEEAGETKAKELNVSGQALLIVAGGTKINITNEGFMNARSNPDKFKAIIKEKIDPLL